MKCKWGKEVLFIQIGTDNALGSVNGVRRVANTYTRMCKPDMQKLSQTSNHVMGK